MRNSPRTAGSFPTATLRIPPPHPEGASQPTLPVRAASETNSRRPGHHPPSPVLQRMLTQYRRPWCRRLRSSPCSSAQPSHNTVKLPGTTGSSLRRRHPFLPSLSPQLRTRWCRDRLWRLLIRTSLCLIPQVLRGFAMCLDGQGGVLNEQWGRCTVFILSKG